MNFLDKLKIVLKEIWKEDKMIFLTLFMIFLLAIISNFCSVEASADTELEFLNITNTEFNTDYKVTANTRVVYDFEVDGLVSWTNYLSSGGTSYLIQSNSIPTSFSFFYSGNPVSRELEMLSGRHQIIIDKGSLYLDNTFLCSSAGSELSWVGGLSFNNSDSHPEVFKIYDLKIYENDDLVKHYKPYLQNNVYGFKETVNSEFIEVENATGEEQFNLKLNVSTTDITQNFVVIKTQELSEDFLNSHKCFYSYSYNSDGSRIWYEASISNSNYYYTYALDNGSYVFKVEDLSGNVVSSATMTITNISPVTDNQDSNILRPVLSAEPVDSSLVRIKTQSLNNELINRYRCYWWVSGETLEDKKEAYPETLDNNSYYFYTVTEEDNTFYFIFYDIENKKYSDIVSLTVLVSEVLTNPIYGGQQTLSGLLEQKFGVFYNFIDYLKEFWGILSADNIEPPVFEIKLPDFLGGNTFNVFDIEIFDKYKNYVHYILAGFIYYFYIKKMTTVIPNIIRQAGS